MRCGEVPSIVGRASLRVEQASFGQFGNIEVTELGRAVLVQENVGRLHISVHNFVLVEQSQSFQHLYERFPNKFLFQVFFALLLIDDSLVCIAIICIFKYQTKPL